MKKIILALCVFSTFQILNAQNIGINQNGAIPDASALLDINAAPTNDKGLLIPRIALTQTSSNAPIGVGIANSLLVYNTATINDVTPGYYYWDGTKWVKFSADGDDWKITGNTNTTVGTNFIGTINNTGLSFRTNNTEQMRLQSGGQLTIGSTTAGGKLDVHQTASNDVARFMNYANIPTLRIRRAQGTILAPTATGTSGTVLARIHADGYDGAGYTTAAQIEMVVDATGGTSTDMPGRIAFFTTPDGSGTTTERMRINNAGNVGIGTAFPTSYPTGLTPTLVHVFDGGTTVNDFAQLQLGANKTSATNKVGELNFHSSVNAADRRTASIESFITGVTGVPNLSGDLRFFTNNATTASFSEKMRITGNGNVRIGVTGAATLAPAQVDAANIRLDVSGGFTRIGNFNSGNNAADHPGTSFSSGVGALAIGMNRTTSTSNVDFWNTTANGQATANLAFHRGFDWRRYDNSGNEELVMALRGDGILTLTSNDATTEGAQLILNNAGFVGVSEINSWSIDNHNSPTSAHSLRFFYNANTIPAIIIPDHVDGAATVGINLPTGTNPITTLHVAGGIAANQGYATKPGSAGAFGGNAFNFNWTGVNLDAWVDVTNMGTILSDRRLKENIQPIKTNATERIMQLNPVTFKYKAIEGTIFTGSDVIYEGFIADELQQIIPSAVRGEKNALTSEGTIQPQSIELFPIVSLLTKAIQEQQVLIEQQAKEIEYLKSKIN
ncbi:MAG: hypothetical protein CVT95_05490 [Bacteroidetes bacterium HGW-Bacteroidetes-12]|nr:MAG: hypothetical protein CVT95_05490 [Bacteroidetes bacterium HGW-Bacteroidetes-12]